MLNGAWLIIIFLVLAVVFIIAIINGAKKGLREAREAKEREAREQEARRAEFKAWRAEQDRIEKRKTERELHKLDVELARGQTELNYKDVDGLYADHSRPEQQNRMDRAFEQKDKLIIQAYDTRYGIAKIQGTSLSKYLTSMQQCTCEDFWKRRKPCKHMYRLANWLDENPDTFKEMDYETGLEGIHTVLEGTFAEGKDAASMIIRERGGIAFSEQKASSFPLHICVVGKSRAVKKFEDMRARDIMVLRYQDILKLFTSEIRHPEIEDSAFYGNTSANVEI